MQTRLNRKTGADIWLKPLFGDRKPFPYLQTEFDETYAKLSPNGKWLAYNSDETKQNEIYVQTFPAPGGKWQVSINGGTRPVWSRDGKELYFFEGDRKLMAVQVNGDATFGAGVPKALFELINRTNSTYDVGNDGRFLMPVVLQNSTPYMTVVVNWTAKMPQ